ncbi:MAG TPA: flagellar basal body rod protein FlgC [Verrucomicrobiae bacterium]|nr:flagellar basal body rod protein FlgC [Verrucomicrobiae bacterium]
MDFMTAMQIGASGLTAQRQRMDTIASNLANIETTRTPEGGPYKRKDVMFTALPIEDFSKTFHNTLADQVRQVAVTEVVEDQSPPTMVFNPNHPDANAEGYVAMPNINMMEEIVNLMNATRSFEANVQSINAAKSMALRAIDLGR